MKGARFGTRVAALVVPLLLCAPASNAADGTLEQAKALVSRATVEYNVGRFDQALELYTQAYEKYPKPALLFNIGQCHKLLGHYERALFFYHGYLRENPDASNRALVEQRIDESQHALDAQRAAEAEAARNRAAQPATAPQPAAAPEAASVTPPSTTAPSQPVETEQHTTGLPVLRMVGLVTAGVGVALVGTGVFFGLKAQSASSDISQLSQQHGSWSSHYQSEYDSGKSAASLANILFGAGAGAVAVGAVLTWMGWPKSAPVGAAFATPVPGGAAAGVSGTF
jgi:tetratricopeptide (TPR) repeat protein